MLETLPLYLSLLFISTTVLTYLLFAWTIKTSADPITRKRSDGILIVLLAWISLQAFLTIKGVYIPDPKTFPPRILLFGVAPALLACIIPFFTKNGKRFIKTLPLKQLTYLHIVRLPVEISLYWLFVHKAIPGLMTFEGRNFDILAGTSAPIVAWYAFAKGSVKRNLLLLWNFFCLGLLLNIVIHALLSAPTPLQHFAFDQPNIAIFYFPYSWLPVFVVPIVLFAHLVAITRLVNYGKQGTNPAV